MQPQSITPAAEPPAAEEWRPITLYKDWEGAYSVSSFGNVRREATGQGARAGHILKPSRHLKGYPRVMLSRAGQHRHGLLHRLVAWEFNCSDAIDAEDFRHIEVEWNDGDMDNNRPENLKCTRRTRQRPSTLSERTLDRVSGRSGRVSGHRRGKKPRFPKQEELAAFRRLLDRTAANRADPVALAPFPQELDTDGDQGLGSG